MTALVAGGCGFVGLNVAQACLAAGERVVLLDRSAPPAAAAAAFDALPGRWTHIAADVTDAADVDAAFRAHRPQHVYYGAAVTSGPAREREHPEQVLAVNLLGLAHVLKAAAAHGARRLVNLSSGSAYGEGGFRESGAAAPLDESATRPMPSTIYGVTKLASEGLARRHAALTGLDALSVRLAIVFGPWERDTGARDTLSAPMQMAEIAAAGGSALLARRDARDWTYSRHVAAAVRALMEAPSPRFDLYHVSAGRTCSALDWGEALAAHLPGFRCRLCAPGEAPNVDLHGDRDRLVMSPRRLAEDIGHVVPGELEATAADFASWITAHREYWSPARPPA